MTLPSSDDSPLLLLIPGLDGTGLMYERHVEALAERYRVRPWWFRPRSDFDYADLVSELGEGTADEPLGSVVVAAESFGGSVALHFVLTFPHLVSRLVLINTFARYPGRLRIRLAERLAPLLRVSAFQGIKDLVVERVLVREGILEEERREYHRIVRQVDLGAYRRRLELILEVDLLDRLPEIQAPTLLLASGRDKIVPSVREARRMAALIPKATVREFPSAGHALLLTPGFVLADWI